MISASNNKIASARSISLTVSGHSAPAINVGFTSGSVKETPGIRKTMML